MLIMYNEVQQCLSNDHKHTAKETLEVCFFFEGEKVSNSAVAESFTKFHTFYFLKMELKTE